MKTKQINFFLTQEDVDDFYSFLQAAGWGAIPMKLSSSDVRLTNDKPNEAFFALKHQIKLLSTKYIENSNSYKVRITNSPAVEFWAPSIDVQNKILCRGRIFLTCDYFTSDGLVEKNSEFINASKNLLSWFRRHLVSVKDERFGDILVSARAKKWEVENQGTLSKNNQF